ncbi:DMT family transporter [Metabacillus litoralis]|uniref:DMT family transporter n=1 Tax=Metabacillus TaxID=2675233 RepID=UPI001B91E027|nr:DMT family transporter [Metabacillus litoralis]MCM3159886.1 DMT family transporter [Metabacillus litoralis]MCM3408466.1 DMT family transporter [Metabacillus litoralis]UHA59865.1 DMT family transporter [Metabacillus litoralis]
MKSNSVYYLALILVSVIWGVNFGISRFGMEVFTPEIFAFFRFGLAVPILFAVLKWTEGSMKVDKRDLLKLALIGFFGVTVLEILVMYSIKYTTLANASLLNVAPWPIFAALFAPFFTKEVMTPRLAIGGLVALIGVVLIILGGPNGFDFSSEYMLGNILALSISLIGALFNLACMPLMKKYSPLRVSSWYMLFGTILMFPITLGGWHAVQMTDFTISVWGAIAYNVVLCTVAAFVLWNLSMNKVGAAKANFYRYFVPASATVTGALFFNEQIFVAQIAGGLVIVLGLAFIAMEKKPKISVELGS